MRSTSVSPPPKTEALMNLERDLKRDLPSATSGKEAEKKKVPSLKREDTEDSDDEFVDAEG